MSKDIKKSDVFKECFDFYKDQEHKIKLEKKKVDGKEYTTNILLQSTNKQFMKWDNLEFAWKTCIFFPKYYTDEYKTYLKARYETIDKLKKYYSENNNVFTFTGSHQYNANIKDKKTSTVIDDLSISRNYKKTFGSFPDNFNPTRIPPKFKVPPPEFRIVDDYQIALKQKKESDDDSSNEFSEDETDQESKPKHTKDKNSKDVKPPSYTKEHDTNHKQDKKSNSRVHVTVEPINPINPPKLNQQFTLHLPEPNPSQNTQQNQPVIPIENTHPIQPINTIENTQQNQTINNNENTLRNQPFINVTIPSMDRQHFDWSNVNTNMEEEYKSLKQKNDDELKLKVNNAKNYEGKLFSILPKISTNIDDWSGIIPRALCLLATKLIDLKVLSNNAIDILYDMILDKKDNEYNKSEHIYMKEVSALSYPYIIYMLGRADDKNYIEENKDKSRFIFWECWNQIGEFYKFNNSSKINPTSKDSLDYTNSNEISQNPINIPSDYRNNELELIPRFLSHLAITAQSMLSSHNRDEKLIDTDEDIFIKCLWEECKNWRYMNEFNKGATIPSCYNVQLAFTIFMAIYINRLNDNQNFEIKKRKYKRMRIVYWELAHWITYYLQNRTDDYTIIILDENDNEKQRIQPYKQQTQAK